MLVRKMVVMKELSGMEDAGKQSRPKIIAGKADLKQAVCCQEWTEPKVPTLHDLQN